MRFFITLGIFVFITVTGFGQDKKSDSENLQYKLLATTRTSTMQKEISETAAQGYRIVVGAPTSGSEMALFLSRDGTVDEPYAYKLLATTRTGTMQKEMNELADAGYRLIPSTMIAKKQFIGGIEIVMILEKPPKVKKAYEYKLLATTRTSTLQKEVSEAKEAGYVVVGMVSRDEHMVVMERERSVAP
ncbi:MAG TPA: hypothetical protein PLP21_14915 [Pyrinomonadaceae bacterium]|nr:hypothetical protein [Acidobacteriota bacterium]HQZ97611.1 hypothetical protein [Pyrinomonadaceae bacterium]